ncbi:unnamed protein product [Vitrella brassicaformis CCMP3155]|uniref:S-adenosylmethionine synthetase N-terminal domain-containing protein n=1 Tax=Vitrella brassicaformis (strain CCMP3155) TaxID=1169540 RepID=A0A0G4FJ98_VITBC|nr:unnamed protein product [Vitrella brassicaformis CCMP3155]|eukprot:CEM13131.1 unnamed protein product [Vitrella brassicaformis CCMP3155]
MRTTAHSWWTSNWCSSSPHKSVNPTGVPFYMSREVFGPLAAKSMWRTVRELMASCQRGLRPRRPRRQQEGFVEVFVDGAGLEHMQVQRQATFETADANGNGNGNGNAKEDSSNLSVSSQASTVLPPHGYFRHRSSFLTQKQGTLDSIPEDLHTTINMTMSTSHGLCSQTVPLLPGGRIVGARVVKTHISSHYLMPKGQRQARRPAADDRLEGMWMDIVYDIGRKEMALKNDWCHVRATLEPRGHVLTSASPAAHSPSPGCFLVTSEAVTLGHPDKLCDVVADAVVDECKALDAEALANVKGHLPR